MTASSVQGRHRRPRLEGTTLVLREILKERVVMAGCPGDVWTVTSSVRGAAISKHLSGIGGMESLLVSFSLFESSALPKLPNRSRQYW